MVMIVNFADGFTSATQPDTLSFNQQSYTVTDNQASFSNFTGFTLDSSETKTVFANFELIRGSYKQNGSITFSYVSGAWVINYGEYSGDTLLQDTLVAGQSVVLDVSGSQVRYKSGSIGSAGTFKVLVNGVSV